MQLKKTHKGFYLAAGALAVVLYLAGVGSGLIASRVISQQTKEEISFLREYIDVLTSSLESLQIEEGFFSALDEEESCNFSILSYQGLERDLGYYWNKLPTRLEEYEQKYTITEEYVSLKSTYTKLSLRAWILATKNYRRCSTKLIPVLYFYSSDCSSCVRQGEILDEFKSTMETHGYKVIVFTVDYGSDERSLSLIREYYGVNNVPAIIIKDRMISKELVTEDEIRRMI